MTSPVIDCYPDDGIPARLGWPARGMAPMVLADHSLPAVELRVRLHARLVPPQKTGIAGAVMTSSSSFTVGTARLDR